MALCKKQDKRGMPVIDGLKICFTADFSLFEQLEAVSMGETINIGDYTLHRGKGKNHSHKFSVFHFWGGILRQFGDLSFGLYGDDGSFANMMWLKIDNRALYDEVELRRVYDFADTLNLTFNNFTTLDIAKDFKKNASLAMLRHIRNPENKVIFNRDPIDEREKYISGITEIRSVSLKRSGNPTLCFKQKNAQHDKTKGATVTTYNKKQEIEGSSGKQYIMDFYDNPLSLHRVEVHLNYKEVMRCGGKWNTAPLLDWIFDREVLEGMFSHYLEKVIRFRNKRTRKLVDWCKELMS